MERLARLRYTRNVYRNRLDDGTSTLDSLIEKRDFLNAEAKIDVINGLIYKLEEVNAALLEEAADENALGIELQEEEKLLELKAELASKVRHIQVEKTPIEGSRDHAGGSSSDKGGGVRVKLPLLHIPVFDGDVDEFMGWYEMFLSTIDKNTKLTDIDRFNYLKSFLSGRAKDVIDGIPLTSSNYRVALDLLCKRYNRPRLIVKSLLGKILPPVTVAHNFESLKNLFATFEVTYRNLQNLKNLKDLNIDSESVGFVFGVLLQWMWPSELALAFERKFHDVEIPSFQDTLKFLESEIQHYENLNMDKQFQVDSNSSRNKFSSNYRKPQTIDSLWSKVSTEKQIKCTFCKNEKHFSSTCREATSWPIDKKRSKIRENRACMRCLGFRHFRVNCRNSNVRCTKCNSTDHWSIMCDNNRSNFSNSNFGNNNAHREPSRFLDNRDPSRETKKKQYRENKFKSCNSGDQT